MESYFVIGLQNNKHIEKMSFSNIIMNTFQEHYIPFKEHIVGTRVVERGRFSKKSGLGIAKILTPDLRDLSRSFRD